MLTPLLGGVLIGLGASLLLLAAGLVLAGMTQPQKIVGFLDPRPGHFDPSLLLVMCGAIGVHVLAQLWARRLPKPLLAESFPTHPAPRLDPKLIGGSAVFGLGW